MDTFYWFKLEHYGRTNLLKLKYHLVTNDPKIIARPVFSVTSFSRETTSPIRVDKIVSLDAAGAVENVNRDLEYMSR